MKMDGRQIYTQAEGAQTNLVVELFQGEQLISYCCKMMENNVIPGLLPVRHQILDGVYRMKYNLNGKLRLQDYLMQRQLDYTQGLTLLRNLTDTLLQMGEYFLSVGQCILDTRYVYVGDGLRVYLICLPLEGVKTDETAAEVQEFYEKLLSSYFATADCTDYDDMFKWIYRASPFDLSTLREKFLAGFVAEQPVPTRTIPQQTPVCQSEPAAAESVRPVRPVEKQPATDRGPDLETPAKASVMNIPGGGSFAVPEPAQPHKKSKKEKHPKPEKKKGFWPFGSHENKQKLAGNETPVLAPAFMASEQRSTESGIPASSEQWERGTILVTGGQDEGTVLARPGRQSGCYLIHNNTRVDVTVMPFIIGQYNTTKHVDYAIYNNSNVSRQHAIILMNGDSYMVQDNHSLNGTFVNGQRLAVDQMVPVQDGDEIRLYNEIFVFHTR